MNTHNAGVNPLETRPTRGMRKVALRSGQSAAQWEAEFLSRCAAKAQAAADRKACPRRGKAAKDDVDPKVAIYAEMRAAALAELRARVQARLNKGFQFKGGLVTDNPAYARPAFTRHGLVSQDHPILLHFVSKTHRRKRLLVGATKGEVVGVDKKLLGLDAAYVCTNPRVVGVVRVEVDEILTWADIAEACLLAEIPLPNIAVGHMDDVGGVHNPHLIWLLIDSVPVEGVQNIRFKSKLWRVRRGLTAALLGIGADPGGMANPDKHKNPLSPLWSRRVLADRPYELSELGSHVDTTLTQADLDKLAAERGHAVRLVPDHPAPEVASESNKLWACLSRFAREQVGPWKGRQGLEGGLRQPGRG